MGKDELIAFESEIAGLFNAGQIRHPVHLSDGNEDALIDYFARVKPGDWCLGSWRFHYQCLLKGVPPAELKAACMRGDSIALCFPAHRILCSAIVGGTLPIALGIALAIKRSGESSHVHCWMGDMTAHSGIAHECMKYAENHSLPITWIVEDNGISVLTDTHETWGDHVSRLLRLQNLQNVHYYRYRSRWPHAGAGRRIQF